MIKSAFIKSYQEQKPMINDKSNSNRCPSSLISSLGSVEPSQQMKSKTKQIIRKKAQLYGLIELKSVKPKNEPVAQKGEQESMLILQSKHTSKDKSNNKNKKSNNSNNLTLFKHLTKQRNQHVLQGTLQQHQQQLQTQIAKSQCPSSTALVLKGEQIRETIAENKLEENQPSSQRSKKSISSTQAAAKPFAELPIPIPIPISVPLPLTLPLPKKPSSSSVSCRNFPSAIKTLQDLIKQHKEVMHMFKEKLNHDDINDIVYLYLKMLSMVIQKESVICEKQISQEKTILIRSLYFIAESFLELGAGFEKLTVFLAMTGVQLCEFYERCFDCGKFLLIIAKVFRKLCKYDQTILILKKSLEYIWINRNRDRTVQHVHLLMSVNQTTDFELQIYNELSYCLLQLNRKNQSQTFAEKYEIGYTQPAEDSKVMGLSKQLILSSQKRVVPWQRLDKRRLELIFCLKLDQYLQQNKKAIKERFSQAKLLTDMKINFQSMIDAFMKKDMFFYQIPMPLETSKHQEQFQKIHKLASRISSSKRFISKKRATSQQHQPQSVNAVASKRISSGKQKVEQNRIFNYRGIGMSRTKLTNIMSQFLEYLKGRFPPISQMFPLMNNRHGNIGHSHSFKDYKNNITSSLSLSKNNDKNFWKHQNMHSQQLHHQSHSHNQKQQKIHHDHQQDKCQEQKQPKQPHLLSQSSDLID